MSDGIKEDTFLKDNVKKEQRMEMLTKMEKSIRVIDTIVLILLLIVASYIGYTYVYNSPCKDVAFVEVCNGESVRTVYNGMLINDSDIIYPEDVGGENDYRTGIYGINNT